MTKSIKIGGHLGTFFSQIPADLGSLSEKFPKFVQCGKKKDFGWQFLVKTGFLDWCIQGVKSAAVDANHSMWVIHHWFGILSSWAWTWTDWPRLNLTHACLGIHGLKYMDISTVYLAPPSTLLTKSKILQSWVPIYLCVSRTKPLSAVGKSHASGPL